MAAMEHDLSAEQSAAPTAACGWRVVRRQGVLARLRAADLAWRPLHARQHRARVPVLQREQVQRRGHRLAAAQTSRRARVPRAAPAHPGSPGGIGHAPTLTPSPSRGFGYRVAVILLSFTSDVELTCEWPGAVGGSPLSVTTDGEYQVSSFTQGTAAVLVFEMSEQSEELTRAILDEWRRFAAAAGLLPAPASLGPQLGWPGGVEGFRYSIVPGPGGGLGVKC
jgi:hypothetical protein